MNLFSLHHLKGGPPDLWKKILPKGNTVYLYMSNFLSYILKMQKVSNIAFDEDIIENNYIFVTLRN